LLGALEEQKLLTREALLRTAARMRSTAKRLEAAEAEAFKAAGGKLHSRGWASLERWQDAPASLIARLIRAVSGADFAPGEAEAGAAVQTFKDGGGATLGGALLKRHGSGLAICREPAALLGRAGVSPVRPVALAPGARVLWDGRFIVSSDARGAPMNATVEIAPVGDQAAAIMDAFGKEWAPVEAIQCTPTVEMEELGAGAVIRTQSLLEERFYGRVMRFS
ncbi:MAG: hypothetical protein WD076_06415, partial [Parvularculaceae bacterium]